MPVIIPKADYYAHNRDFKNWDARKRRTNRNKTRIEVNYSDLNIFVYPEEENLILMQFNQTYESNDLNLKSPKELYWREYDNGWKIVYEGVRLFPKVGIEMVGHEFAVKRNRNFVELQANMPDP